MIGLFSAGKNNKEVSAKYLLLTFFVCVSVIAWLGISNLRADEDDPEDNMDNSEVSFQNTAQAQRAENIATQVALQDPEGKTIEEITEDIYHMRSTGMGWGEIAQYYGFPPSISGLGHFKSNHENAAQISKHPHWKTELQEATTRSFNGGTAKGHGVSESNTGQNDPGRVHTKNYRKILKKGVASGYSKDKSSNHGGGHGRGNGGGHGGGNGGDHGGGNGGDHGGGNGGGRK